MSINNKKKAKMSYKLTLYVYKGVNEYENNIFALYFKIIR